MSGAGTGTAKNFREASPDEVKQLLKTHLSVFIERETGEVYIAYSIKCGDGSEPCPLPPRPDEPCTSTAGPVTFRICPSRPCAP